MEPRNDNTWLFIGIAAGCGLLLLLALCGAGAAAFLLMRGAAATPPPSMPMPPPSPPPSVTPPSLPPPSLPPPLLPPSPVTPPSTDLAPRLVRATVTSVTGASAATTGQTCEFNVERHDRPDGTFWCNAQMVCGGRLLFGGPNAGYFNCTLYDGPPRHVVGGDPLTSGQETQGDSAMQLSTIDGTLEIWDDAAGPNGEFHLTAHVDSVE